MPRSDHRELGNTKTTPKRQLSLCASQELVNRHRSGLFLDKYTGLSGARCNHSEKYSRSLHFFILFLFIVNHNHIMHISSYCVKLQAMAASLTFTEIEKYHESYIVDSCPDRRMRVFYILQSRTTYKMSYSLLFDIDGNIFG